MECDRADPDERVFVNYVRDNYGRHLAEILEYNGGPAYGYQSNPGNSVLAFDIPVEDDDDQFNMSRHQSETHHYNQGSPAYGRASEQPSTNYHGGYQQQLQQQDSGKYHQSKGFSRRNLQDSESQDEGSEDDNTEERHFKRRMRRDRSNSLTRRSRSRSFERARGRRSHPQHEAQDYDPLNPLSRGNSTHQVVPPPQTQIQPVTQQWLTP